MYRLWARGALVGFGEVHLGAGCVLLRAREKVLAACWTHVWAGADLLHVSVVAALVARLWGEELLACCDEERCGD